MLRNKRTWAFTAAICGLAAVAVFLQLRTQETDPAEAIIRDAERQSLPAGCRRLGSVEVARKAFSIHAAWELQADMTWAEYCAKVADRFRSAAYIERLRTDAKIGFAKTLPGDTLSIVIELAETNPLRVRVTLGGHPS